MRSIRPVLMTVGWIFLIPGVIQFVVAGIWVWRTQSWLDASEHGQGVVVDLSGTGSQAPVIRFTTPDGTEHTFTDSLASKPPRYRLGDQVAIRYATADPADAIVDSFISLWFVPTVIGILGVAATGVGVASAVVVPWFMRRSARPAAGASSAADAR
jgi:hypothetical protein